MQHLYQLSESFNFRDAFLEGDFSGCVDVARAINTVQGLFGQIPHVLAHGRAAKAVVNTLDLLNNQNSPKKTHQVNLHFFCSFVWANWHP